MGLTLEFFAGDKPKMIEAYQNEDLDAFDDPAIVAAKADLSLHILPKDLNMLSLAFSKFNGLPPFDLRSHLTVIADEEGAGILSVDDKWVTYVAAVPLEKEAEISEIWADAMRKEYDDPDTQATDAMTESVRDLIRVCQVARQRRLSVVHTWNG